MCTVVCRWSPGAPVPITMLALRDELASRAFDLPGTWWPELPGIVGGRDRQAGGSWCVSDPASGVTAVVLNSPLRRVAAPGAPSRGTLPLLAIARESGWPEAIDVTQMASFHLLLARPDGLTWWFFDGSTLVMTVLGRGTHMLTPGGPAVPDKRFVAGRIHVDEGLGGETDSVWSDWLDVIGEAQPSTDPMALLVSRPIGKDSFETVFGQFIAIRPGALRLDYAARPAGAPAWTTAFWAGPTQVTVTPDARA